MSASPGSLSRRSEYLVLSLIVVLSLALMFLSADGKDAAVRALNGVALAPVQAGLSGVRALVGLRAENDSLRADLMRASLEIAALREKSLEAERLRAMLEFRDLFPLRLRAARVIARGPEPITSIVGQFLIDKGERDGVLSGMAVVRPEGIVGKVVRSSETYAVVRPLLHPGCRVSARLVRTRTVGILGWDNEVGLHLTFLPYRAEVSPGDEIVATGLGQVFPAGLPLGRIVKIENDPLHGTPRAVVEPALDFASIEEVFVVLRLPMSSAAARGPDARDPAPGARRSSAPGGAAGRAGAR